MTVKEKLEFIFGGAAVTRFHVESYIKPQTDGARKREKL